MAKVKHVADASERITEAFGKMPEKMQEICIRLRGLIHQAEPGIIEDWKWGPNFYMNGMVCNVWGFRNHAAMVFFNGTSMKDTHHLFNAGEANSRTCTIKFTDIGQVKDKVIIAYVKESVAINKKGEKKVITQVEIPAGFKKQLQKHKLLDVFEKLNFTTRKEIALGIAGAKKEETRERRINKAIELLMNKKG